MTALVAGTTVASRNMPLPFPVSAQCPKRAPSCSQSRPAPALCRTAGNAAGKKGVSGRGEVAVMECQAGARGTEEADGGTIGQDICHTLPHGPLPHNGPGGWRVAAFLPLSSPFSLALLSLQRLLHCTMCLLSALVHQ